MLFNRVALSVLIYATSTLAFTPSQRSAHQYVSQTIRRNTISTTKSSSLLRVSVPLGTASVDTNFRQCVFRIPRENVTPILKFGRDDKEKIVNLFGLWCLTVTVLSGVVWIATMHLLSFFNKTFPNLDPNRAVYDKSGKIWSKFYLHLTNSFPTQSGNLLALNEKQKACLYVANHASWLDIAVLCTVLDPVFKFIAKGELRGVPCIGQQLTGGNHILLDRDDRKSQLRAFKEGLNWLKNGVPIMAFPEGKRSEDGRLSDFKGGIFSMAVKAKVPIVPLTICNTHAVMPRYTLFPIQNGKGKLHVHVHDAIDTLGKTEAELAALVRKAFLSELPYDQLPIEDVVPQIETTVSLEIPKPIVQLPLPTNLASNNNNEHHQHHHHEHTLAHHDTTVQNIGEPFHHTHLHNAHANAITSLIDTATTTHNNVESKDADVPFFAIYDKPNEIHTAIVQTQETENTVA